MDAIDVLDRVERLNDGRDRKGAWQGHLDDDPAHIRVTTRELESVRQIDGGRGGRKLVDLAGDADAPGVAQDPPGIDARRRIVSHEEHADGRQGPARAPDPVQPLTDVVTDLFGDGD